MDSIREEVSRYKRRLCIYMSVYAALFLIVITGIIIFYEMRIRSVIGEMYLINAESAKNFIDVIFDAKTGGKGIKHAVEAMRYAGYTENGFTYLFTESGQWVVIGICLCMFICLLFLCFRLTGRIGNHDLYGRMIELVKENSKISEELKANMQYVDKRNKQLQNFIENIAHQVKTPLAAMSLSLDMLKAKNSSKRLDAYINQCFYHVERISEFIKRLLDISRMESGKMIFSSEPVVVSDIINQAITAAAIEGDKISAAPDDDYIIYGDGEWLKEALVTIMTNSCEYINDIPNGRIFIDTVFGQEQCLITVSDNGKGFDTACISHIFDRFETNSDSKSFHVGIGLNLAKLVIEAHHGTISAENSDKYGGAAFLIRLPKYILKSKK